MRGTLENWLTSGKIIRDTLNGFKGQAIYNENSEWSGGSRLQFYVLDPRNDPGLDWQFNLRHEFGHAYENHPGNTDSYASAEERAEQYENMCDPIFTSYPPPPSQAAGVAANITSLPAEVSVGDTVYASSNCSGATTWSGGGGVAVTTNGAVIGIETGAGFVRVDCRGTFRVKSISVTAGEPLNCNLAQRIVSGVTSVPPSLAYEEECGGEPAPTPPAGGMGEDGSVDCYVITAVLYYWDEWHQDWLVEDSWVVAYVCYQYGNMT